MVDGRSMAMVAMTADKTSKAGSSVSRRLRSLVGCQGLERGVKLARIFRVQDPEEFVDCSCLFMAQRGLSVAWSYKLQCLVLTRLDE